MVVSVLLVSCLPSHRFCAVVNRRQCNSISDGKLHNTPTEETCKMWYQNILKDFVILAVTTGSSPRDFFMEEILSLNCMSDKATECTRSTRPGGS